MGASVCNPSTPAVSWEVGTEISPEAGAQLTWLYAVVPNKRFCLMWSWRQGLSPEVFLRPSDVCHGMHMSMCTHKHACTHTDTYTHIKIKNNTDFSWPWTLSFIINKDLRLVYSFTIYFSQVPRQCLTREHPRNPRLLCRCGCYTSHLICTHFKYPCLLKCKSFVRISYFSP